MVCLNKNYGWLRIDNYGDRLARIWCRLSRIGGVGMHTERDVEVSFFVYRFLWRRRVKLKRFLCVAA